MLVQSDTVLTRSANARYHRVSDSVLFLNGIRLTERQLSTTPGR